MTDYVVTAQTLIDNSVARAKDTYKTQWSDAKMLTFLNAGLHYVEMLLFKLKSELLISDVTISLSAATQEYSLADKLPDFLGIVDEGVYFSDVVGHLKSATYDDKQRLVTTSTDAAPLFFYITDTTFGLLPIPSSASVSTYATLNCRYYKRMTDLTLFSNMPFKNIFNGVLSMFMDSLAILKVEENTAEYTSILNTLEEGSLAIVKGRDATIG